MKRQKSILEYVQEARQINESRKYAVEVEVSVKDSMNNAAIEDEFISLLTSKNFNIIDVTAKRV